MVMRPPSYLDNAQSAPNGASLDRDAEGMARRLGWLSVALGALEVFAPGTLARAVGTGGSRPTRILTRALGVRELASGVGILTTPRPTMWLSSRVAGDVMAEPSRGSRRQ